MACAFGIVFLEALTAPPVHGSEGLLPVLHSSNLNTEFIFPSVSAIALADLELTC